MDQDVVAAVVAEFSQHRPDLDADPSLVLARVKRLSELVDRALRELCRRERVSLGEYDILAALRRAGTPFSLAPTQLVSRTGVTPGAVTKRVDGLQQRGLVDRTVVALDARGRVVSLTPEGRELVDRLVAEHVELQRQIIGDLAPAEVTTLSGFLDRLTGNVEQIVR